jgi:hypothetical protein
MCHRCVFSRSLSAPIGEPCAESRRLATETSALQRLSSWHMGCVFLVNGANSSVVSHKQIKFQPKKE